MPHSGHDNIVSEVPPEYYNTARTEIRDLLPEKASRILELGCGGGATLSWLRSIYGDSYRVGIEYDQTQSEIAQQHAHKIITGNIEQIDLPFEPQHFDLILALDVLEHLGDPWSVVRRLALLLSPSGTLIVSLPNIAHFSVALPLLLGRWSYADYGLLDRTHLRFFVRKTAIDLVNSSGLHVVQVASNVAFPSMLKFLNRRFFQMLYWSIGNYGRAICARFHPFQYQYLIAARWPKSAQDSKTNR